MVYIRGRRQSIEAWSELLKRNQGSLLGGVDNKTTSRQQHSLLFGDSVLCRETELKKAIC